MELVGADNMRQWRIVVEFFPNATDKAKWYWEVREGGELLQAGHETDYDLAAEQIGHTLGLFL